MGLFSRGGGGYPTTTIADPIEQHAHELDGELIQIIPYADNEGIDAAARLWNGLHSPEIVGRLRTKNNSAPIAFELWFDAGLIDFHAHAPVSAIDRLETKLENCYPDSLFHTVERDALGFPEIDAGDHVAGATLTLKNHSFYPLQDRDAGFSHDPYGDLLGEIAGGDSRVFVQAICRPEPATWTTDDGDGGLLSSGRSVTDVAEGLQKGTVSGWRNPTIKDPSDQQKAIAKAIEAQAGKRGFNVTLRVLTIDAEAETASARCEAVCEEFEQLYERNQVLDTGGAAQSLTAIPVSTATIRPFIDAAKKRQWTDEDVILTIDELAPLAHLPNADEIATPDVNWSQAQLGDGVPPGTPRFDFDAIGVSEDASKVEKQVAMLDHTGAGDPYYYGFGSKHGTEAGIFPEFLNAHMQVTGRTRMGKTTFGTNHASQAMGRDHGGLVIALGKEDDDEAFISEWPTDRPREDFCFIDTGSAFDKRVRFNLLEVPEELEPGTTEYRSYTESLADDFCAAFAQAGGDSKLYPLMRGITRTLVRGMAKSGRVCTPIDLAAACSRPENMDEFARWMSDERIHFIDDTARRFAEEKDDSDLEPIARRMDEIIHNGNLRDWLAAREPTVRIQDLVDEGKWGVLRIDPALGDTERAFAINPVVRRFAHAKKMAHKTGTNTEPFHVIWDEADKAITPHSNVGQMLSEFGGYGVRFCLLYQSPSYQLPKALREATQAQIDTTISFRTEGKDARFIANQHSEDIGVEDLDLPRYTFLMNTDTRSNESTASYRVDAFDPVREVRARLGDGGMSDTEIQTMKQEAVERYGGTPKTAGQVKAESHFFVGMAEDEQTPAELDMSLDHCRNQALKAIYDESIRNGDPGGFVPVETVLDRLQDYLPGGEAITDTGKAWREVFQQIPDAYLAHRMNDQDDREVKALDTGFMNVGTTENDGADEHWEQMADAYIPMTQLGFVYEIPAQTGEKMPDAIARLDDVLDLDGVDDPGEIAEQVNAYRDQHRLLDRLADTRALYIESEHSTGATQPSQTIQNLVQAANDGHRCLFIAREAVAARVHNTLERAPFCCRSSHPEDSERRFYTATSSLVIDGETMTRPGAAENVWVHDEAADEYVLRDTNGTVHARFSTPQEIFEDAGKYPAGGERSIKPPVIPECEFDSLDDVEYDIVVVPEPERDEHGAKEPLTPFDLQLYQEGNENVPLPYLVDGLDLDVPEATSNGTTTATTTIDKAVSEFRNGNE